MTRLAIVGTRHFQHPHWPHFAGAIIDRALDHLRPELVISGGAEGLDTLAANVARTRGYPVTIHRPQVEEWEAPGGYRERNQKIAEDSTHLLRIACSEATSYGSGWTADEAERLGRVVWRREVAPSDKVNVAGYCVCGMPAVPDVDVLIDEAAYHEEWHQIWNWTDMQSRAAREKRAREFDKQLADHNRMR